MQRAEEAVQVGPPRREELAARVGRRVRHPAEVARAVEVLLSERLNEPVPERADAAELSNCEVFGAVGSRWMYLWNPYLKMVSSCSNCQVQGSGEISGSIRSVNRSSG